MRVCVCVCVRACAVHIFYNRCIQWTQSSVIMTAAADYRAFKSLLGPTMTSVRAIHIYDAMNTKLVSNKR